MSIIADVAKLMQASGQELNSKTATMYGHLIAEEFRELKLANTDADRFDGCLDLIWVTVGYMLARGWPIEAGWAEVARSNHAKIVDGKVIKRADGKTLKPEGWTPPDLAGILAKHQQNQ